MKELTLPNAQIPTAKENTENNDLTCSKKWKFALISSGFSALLLSAAGLFISALAYMDMVARAELFNKIGTVLVLFAAPLYFLAAHCLDKIDLRKKISKKNRRGKSL